VKNKRYNLDFVFRLTSGRNSRRLATVRFFSTDVRAAADHIINQLCDYPANWSPRAEITHAWDTFSEEDQALLTKEGHTP
jgi:hypothetical protein